MHGLDEVEVADGRRQVRLALCARGAVSQVWELRDPNARTAGDRTAPTLPYLRVPDSEALVPRPRDQDLAFPRNSGGMKRERCDGARVAAVDLARLSELRSRRQTSEHRVHPT